MGKNNADPEGLDYDNKKVVIGILEGILIEYWREYRNTGGLIQLASVGAGDQVFHVYGVLYSIDAKITRETGNS